MDFDSSANLFASVETWTAFSLACLTSTKLCNAVANEPFVLLISPVALSNPAFASSAICLAASEALLASSANPLAVSAVSFARLAVVVTAVTASPVLVTSLSALSDTFFASSATCCAPFARAMAFSASFLALTTCSNGAKVSYEYKDAVPKSFGTTTLS